MQLAKPGIWMPNAKILCYECHGPVFKNVIYRNDKLSDKVLTTEKFSEYQQTRLPFEHEIITYCDNCRSDIWMLDGIAMEHNLVDKLRQVGYDAHMDQTGGMNSAACVECGLHYYYITYGFDNDDRFWISKYDAEGDHVDGEYPTVETAEEVIEYFSTMQDIKMLEV